MATVQEQYDEAMFDFSQGRYAESITRLKTLLAQAPDYFDAQLALGMAHYRLDEVEWAIAEGAKAELLKPEEPLVHTNLSLFYAKAGDKETAERHAMRARTLSWKKDLSAPSPTAREAGDRSLAQSKPAPVKLPPKFPDMPWKKKPPIGSGTVAAPEATKPRDPSA